MMKNMVPNAGSALRLAALALVAGGVAGCYYGPSVAYCQAPPATAGGQPENIPLLSNGTCPQGTQPVYAQAVPVPVPAPAPAYYPPPAYAYPYGYGYPGYYPPVSVGFGFRFR